MTIRSSTTAFCIMQSTMHKLAIYAAIVTAVLGVIF